MKKYDFDISCPFCNLSKDVEIIHKTNNVIGFLDKYPVSQGHTLIIPKKHISNYFDLSLEEKYSLCDFVNKCKEILQERYKPDGFNVGINVGESAGQTVFHTHIHLIPRYNGDTENPNGGVRGVIPNKQTY